MFVFIIYSCSKPVERIKNRTWFGSLYRISDNKELSKVAFKITDSNLFIFSNAIFGAGNDTLMFVNFKKEDSTYEYMNKNNEIYSFKLSHRFKINRGLLTPEPIMTQLSGESYNNYQERIDECDKLQAKKRAICDVETLGLIGNDYYIVSDISDFDIKDDRLINFYKHIEVPQEAYLYLDGVYEGSASCDNMINEFALLGMGGISMKLTFLDDFKVKVTGNLSFISETDIQSYKIIGNKLYLIKKHETLNKKKGFIITDNGSRLIYETEGASVILNKIY